MVETNRRPNVGDRWTRIAVRAVWRVAAIPGSGRGGRAEPYTALWSAHRAVFDEASGRERQACGIHCTILAHISECYVSRLYIRIVQLRPDKITERKSGSPYSGFTHYPHHFIGLVSDAMQSQQSAGRALTSGADCKTIRTKNDVARPSPPNASKTPRLRMLGSLTLATCRCRARRRKFTYLLTYQQQHDTAAQVSCHLISAEGLIHANVRAVCNSRPCAATRLWHSGTVLT